MTTILGYIMSDNYLKELGITDGELTGTCPKIFMSAIKVICNMIDENYSTKDKLLEDIKTVNRLLRSNFSHYLQKNNIEANLINHQFDYAHRLAPIYNVLEAGMSQMDDIHPNYKAIKYFTFKFYALYSNLINNDNIIKKWLDIFIETFCLEMRHIEREVYVDLKYLNNVLNTLIKKINKFESTIFEDALLGYIIYERIDDFKFLDIIKEIDCDRGFYTFFYDGLTKSKHLNIYKITKDTYKKYTVEDNDLSLDLSVVDDSIDEDNGTIYFNDTIIFKQETNDIINIFKEDINYITKKELLIELNIDSVLYDDLLLKIFLY